MGRKSIYLSILIGIFVISLVLLTIYQKNIDGQSDRINASLESLNGQEYFSFFTENMLYMAENEGLDMMRARVVKALTNQQINMFHCHSLAHDMGHLWAIDKFYNTLEKVLNSEILDFCGSGFLHGIEGELATLTYPEYAIKMQDFCKLVSRFEHYYSECFHGAGHTFLSITGVGNLAEALDYCNSLKMDLDISVNGCYRGVYSASAELILKNSGTSEDLLDSCLSQTSELQEFCAYELNGFGARPGTSQESLNNYFELCFSDSRATQKFSEACFASVTWVYTDIILGDMGILITPPYINSLSSDLKQLFILHSFNAFKKQIATLPKSVWIDFCSKYEVTEEEYCKLQYKLEM